MPPLRVSGDRHWAIRIQVFHLVIRSDRPDRILHAVYACSLLAAGWGWKLRRDPWDLFSRTTHTPTNSRRRPGMMPRSNLSLFDAGESAEDGAPLSDADKANMFQAALQSLQIQLGEKETWQLHAPQFPQLALNNDVAFAVPAYLC